MIKLLEGIHLKGLMYQSTCRTSPYKWEFVIQAMDETSGQFTGYSFYPGLHPTARILCAGTFALVDFEDQLNSDHVGKLSFQEGCFVPGYRDESGSGLVENACDARLDLFLVPPGGIIELSSYRLEFNRLRPSRNAVNSSAKDVLNARGTWDTPNEQVGRVSEEPCFFTDAVFEMSGFTW
jgi:hypothetical protein